MFWNHPLPHLLSPLVRVGQPLLAFWQRATLPRRVALVTFVVSTFAFFIASVFLHAELPPIEQVRDPQVGLSTRVYAADGVELTQFYEQKRTWVDLATLPPHLIHALIATEDRRFFDHSGIDAVRMAGSLVQTLRGYRQGGSTLTMQLARNLYPEVGREISVWRKMKEVTTAFDLERYHSKETILGLYLNTVAFGFNTFGIEAAAHLYFDKDAADLDVAEAATLIGMLKGTTLYNPARNPERARDRRNLVLRLMHDAGYLSEPDLAYWQDTPLTTHVRRASLAYDLAPHFAEHVRLWMEAWGEANGYDIYRDGLRVHTTLDTRLQATAQAAVEREMRGLQAVVDYEWSRKHGYHLARSTQPYLRRQAAGDDQAFAHLFASRPALVDEYILSTERYRHARQAGQARAAILNDLRSNVPFMDSLRSGVTRLQAGLVSMDPANGHVKAWIGGVGADQYDKVALARRQPGSTFKPFVYASALEAGYSPYSELLDTLHTFKIPATGLPWAPRNAGDRYSGEMMSLTQGLARSKNTITAQLIMDIGAERVATLARNLGIESDLPAVPSLALGTGEVTLLEMTAAYATLANLGQRHTPLVVTRIEDRFGNVLATFGSEPQEALAARTAYRVVDMMRGVIRGGTGGALQYRHGIYADVAGKTGTTQNNADGWFMLMHPSLVTGAWVGFNDPRLTIRSDYWGQGANNALRLVGRYFGDVLDAHPHLADEQFRPQRPVVIQPPLAAMPSMPLRTVRAEVSGG